MAISDVIIACNATDPAQHLRLHYRETVSIVFGGCPALVVIEGDIANDAAIDFQLETFIHTSIAKDTTCGALFIQTAMLC